MPEATTDAPRNLRAARRTLAELSDVELLDDWQRDDGHWYLTLRLSPIGLKPNPSVPASTDWYVRVEAGYPSGFIDLFPAASGGLKDTFAHQLPNRPLAGLAYRGGKICVATDSEGNLRRAGDAEPKTAEDRLAWHVMRSLKWLTDAAADTLLVPGDWFETPNYIPRHSLKLGIAIHEGPETFAAWTAVQAQVGVVDLGRITTPPRFMATLRFRDLHGKVLVEPRWGFAIQAAEEAAAGLWFRFPDVIAQPPYRAPWTWGDLREVAKRQGFDLDARLRDAAVRIRDGANHFGLFGYPVPVRVGDRPSLMHWQPIELPALDRKDRKPPPGFRPGKETGLWFVDRSGPLRSDAELEWRPSDNWHPAQIGSRGRVSPELARARVLVIGAGALGAPAAEMLVRAGVTDMSIIDADGLIAGNLVRHTGTFDNLDESKSDRLAARLNLANPSARVRSYAGRFPDVIPADDPKLAIDLVVDTTGEDGVLQAMSNYPWPSSTSFASFGISVGARRLFSFFARGSTFPRDRFEADFAAWRQAEVDSNEELPWEAVGCWHPVFPARIDEVWLLAAAAVGQLADRWPLRDDVAELVTLERTSGPDGFDGLSRVTGP